MSIGVAVNPVGTEFWKFSCKAALTTETKQHKTIPKHIQNKPKTKPKQFVLGLFQRFVHVKQNAETKQK